MAVSSLKQESESASLSGGGGVVSPAGQGSTTIPFNLLPFALKLGQFKTNAYINYMSGIGIKIFNYSTKKLHRTFDG